MVVFLTRVQVRDLHVTSTPATPPHDLLELPPELLFLNHNAFNGYKQWRPKSTLMSAVLYQSQVNGLSTRRKTCQLKKIDCGLMAASTSSTTVVLPQNERHPLGESIAEYRYVL